MDGAYSPVENRWFRLAFLAGVLLLLSGTIAEAAITVQLFRFSAGRYVRFAVADTGTDLSGVSAPLEGLPIYVADEDTLYCYDGSTWSSCNAGSGGAPTNAEYVVGALHGSLSAERVGTDTAEIDWDFGTAGQAKLNVFTNSLVLSRLKTSDTPSVGECLKVAASDEVSFDTCGGVTDGDKGDITVSGGGATWSLDDDVVAPAEMADADHGDISWSTGVATVDSGAVGLTEIGDDASCAGSQAVRRNAGDTAYECYTPTGGGGGAGDFAPYGEYDVTNPPATVYLSDEFSDDTSTLTYAWGNQGSATVANAYDGLLLDGVNTAEYHAYGIDQTVHTMPTNSDQTFCAAIQMTFDGINTDGCGIGVLDGGTMASPTAQSMIVYSEVSTDSIYFFDDSDFVPAGATTVASKALPYEGAISAPWIFKLSYVDSTRVTTASWSRDGKNWEQFGSTTTLGADPVTWFLTARESAQCQVDWVRLFDSADADCGERGAGENANAPYGELDFDKPPASCALCDEFAGGVSDLTWAWGNQDSASVTLTNDMAYFNGGDTTNEWHGYCIDTATHTLPGDVDQTFCVKLSQLEIDTTNEHVGIVVIGTGTIASPTEIEVLGPGNFTTDSINAASYTAWTLTGGAGISTWPMGVDALSRGSLWLRGDFTASSNNTDYYWSFDGKSWFGLTSGGNLANGPISWCIGGRAWTHGYIDYARLRTDANRTECGE